MLHTPVPVQKLTANYIPALIEVVDFTEPKRFPTRANQPLS